MDLDRAKKIAYDIRGCAFEIWNEYKYGFSEAVYEAALELLLTDKGHHVDRQQYLQCYYKGRPINQSYRLDLVIDDEFILELKTVNVLLPEHRAQVFNYARLTRHPYCMLLNFGPIGAPSELYYVHLDDLKIDLL